MDRYQFEDLISDYIENNLSLSKRKAFEAYMDSHSEARQDVKSIRETIAAMKNMDNVKTSDAFMFNLKTRIARENIQSAYLQKRQRTFFGFTPLYASVFSLMVIALIFTGIQFIPGSGDSVPIPGERFPMAEQTSPPPVVKYQSPNEGASSGNFAETPEDSLDDDAKPLRNKGNFDSRIQLVKNPQ